MPYFTDEFLREVSDRCPIEEVVSRYVDLKRAGSNLQGLCPFHREKTPSFTVSPDKQIFHCFGCGEGGNVFGFIMKTENLDFPEAVEFLCERAGISIPEGTGNNEQNRHRRERMYALHTAAARFFYNSLNAPIGKPALQYIMGRGLSPRAIRRFGLGFAPESWDMLINAMKKKGFTEQEILDGGLASKSKNNGIYDRFRNRLMFPIIDVRGRVVAFGGRVIDDSQPKYLNSSDTLIFNKGRNLFALNFAKAHNKGRIILAEGYMDVIALHQAGFPIAVASLGTALTHEQSKLIGRYAKEVIIAYDADEAGQRATQRAIEVLKKNGLEVKVISMGAFKDPDEYIKKNGAKRFEMLLNEAGNHIEYRLMKLKGRYNLNDLQQKVKCLSEIVDILSMIDSEVERELYTLKAAKEYEISPESLKAELKKVRKKRERRRTVQLKQKEIENILAPVVDGKKQTGRSFRAEEMLINLLYNDNGLYPQIKGELTPQDFSGDMTKRFYTYIAERLEEGGEPDIALMNQNFTAEELSLFAKIISEQRYMKDNTDALRDIIDEISISGAKENALKNTDEKEMMVWVEKQRQQKTKRN